MNKITVIRHSQLEDPFSDYDKLNYNQLEGLALGTIQPNISEVSKHLINKSKLITKNFELILHSKSPRSIQTAKLIAQQNSFPVILIENDLLNEITFSISDLITEEEYLALGLNPLRKRFYQAISAGSTKMEALDSIYSRLEDLAKDLSLLEYKNILLISHGFFMRYIYYYFKHLSTAKKLKKFELQTLINLSTKRYDYLGGFTFNSSCIKN